MTFDAWVSGFLVRAKKSEREVVVGLRFTESQLESEQLKALTRSVYREGSKVHVTLGYMDDRPQVVRSSTQSGWLTSVRVSHGPDGRFIEARIRFAEKDVTGDDFKSLASVVRSGAEPSVKVELEPAAIAQIEMPDANNPSQSKPRGRGKGKGLSNVNDDDGGVNEDSGDAVERGLN